MTTSGFLMMWTTPFFTGMFPLITSEFTSPLRWLASGTRVSLVTVPGEIKVEIRVCWCKVERREIWRSGRAEPQNSHFCCPSTALPSIEISTLRSVPNATVCSSFFGSEDRRKITWFGITCPSTTLCVTACLTLGFCYPTSGQFRILFPSKSYKKSVRNVRSALHR